MFSFVNSLKLMHVVICNRLYLSSGAFTVTGGGIFLGGEKKEKIIIIIMIKRNLCHPPPLPVFL